MADSDNNNNKLYLHGRQKSPKVLITNVNIKYKVLTTKRKAEKGINLHQIILFW